MKNGYFKLVNDEFGYGIKIFAPVDGGEEVRIGEVGDYLSQRGIHFDITALKTAIAQKEDTVLHLGEESCPSENMVYKLSVLDDSMSVVARFFAPSETGSVMTMQEFVNDLSFRQIRFGIKEERIWSAFEKEEYCTDIVVAAGKEPRQGKDAEIEYFFNTNLKAKPTLNDDGSVDFFHLNTINHCHKGDLLARLTPAVPGDYGVNVMGTKIKPRDVKNLMLRYGNNIDISEDKLELTSQVNGHVALVEGRVFVSNVLTVENVDISTGNLEYDGSIQVNGNIQTNFSVQAKGNIVVNGMVEGAVLVAGGDVIIAKGMAGMARGEIKAGGNVVVKFLENAKVSADGYVEAESILHSTVMAGGDIRVQGKKGFISGGRVCATNLIDVKTLGSSMGTATIVEVGADPVVKQKYTDAQKAVTELTTEIKNMDPIISTYILKKKQGVNLSRDQMIYLATVIKAREQKVADLETKSQELEALKEIVEQQANASVVVRGAVYPGVKICIGEVSMSVQSSMQYCKFVKLRGDVKMVSI